MPKMTLFVAALLASATAAQAAPNMVTNGNFEQTPSLLTKTLINGSNSLVTGWTILGGALTYLDSPGAADNGNGLSVYRGFPKSDTVQGTGGGNFIQSDSASRYTSLIYQLVTGLVVGDHYLLTFDFAAGEQSGYKGTNGFYNVQWNASLDTGYNQVAANTQSTVVLTTADGAFAPWRVASMTFTAKATSEYLSFLATGTPNGSPPIAFMDNVALTDVPEPMSLLIVLSGAAGLSIAGRRHARTRRVLVHHNT